MKISDEFKVGVLATFGLAVLIFGYAFLKDMDLFGERKVYYAVYDKVEGLLPSAQVQVRGLPIGRVTDLRHFRDNDTTIKILAVIRIDKELPIPVDSKAEIVSSDLLGEKSVEIILGNSGQLIQPNDTFKTSIQESLTQKVETYMLPVKNKAEELFASFDSVATSIQVILKGGTIDSTIQRAATGMKMLEQTAFHIDSLILAEANNIDTILTNIKNITSTFNENNEDMGRILTNVADITDSLSNTSFVEMVENLNTSLAQLTVLLETANKGEGTIGLLLEDPELYNNLVQITADMDSLLVDLEENPKRYVHFSVFGKKQK